MMESNLFAPEHVHRNAMATGHPRLAFHPGQPFPAWQKEVRESLAKLLGDSPARVDPDVQIEWSREWNGCLETRFTFRSEEYARVPCHLVAPLGAMDPLPTLICLQGHTAGMHISLGRATPDAADASPMEGDRDFALQAIREGFAAVILEQRGFGERVDQRPAESVRGKTGCHHAAMVALMLGRTLLGERCWDVWRLTDILPQFEIIDTSRLAIMGNSAGGTVAYYAAALDERIGAVMPSCSVAELANSWGEVAHCACSYIPGMLQWMDMPDVAGCIAPRPLLVVAGSDDPLAPLTSVERAFERVKAIYQAAGTAEACALTIGNGGHRFFAAEAWPAFRELTGW